MMLRSIVSEKSLKFKFCHTRKTPHPNTSAQNSTKTAANTHETTFIRTTIKNWPRQRQTNLDEKIQI